MKTLIENATKESKYLFPDTAAITLNANMIVTPEYGIGDLNSTNATLVENVTPPEDWYAGKYLYDAGVWTPNPEWVDPTQG